MHTTGCSKTASCTVKAPIPGSMDSPMRAHSSTTTSQDREDFPGKMEVTTSVRSKTAGEMEKDSTSAKSINPATKVFGATVSNKEKDCLLLPMEQSTKDSSRTVCGKVQARWSTLQEMNTKVNGRMIKKKDKDLCHGTLHSRNTKATGKTTFLMVKAHISGFRPNKTQK